MKIYEVKEYRGYEYLETEEDVKEWERMDD